MTADGRPDMMGISRHLGKLEITSVLIEGGALINWAALASGIVDKVFLYYAPKILAGTGSVPFAAGYGFRHMNDAAYVKSIKLHRFGEDLKKSARSRRSNNAEKIAALRSMPRVFPKS
jgi:diaminohydroxyphosphoribosylaminopyrimidine deaminase/5-amino-6-(5-phosphoribosylamino)uracil reductase